MTETGSIMGTAQYLSPEQARGAPVTAASDLYSVGIVLYEMLTGTVPFTGDSPVEIAMKHVSETPQPPSALAPGIPADLDRVVLRALAKNPADRYQTAEEFDNDLSLIEGGLPITRETRDAATAILSRGAAPPAAPPTEVLRRPEAPRQPPRTPPPPDPYAGRPRRRRRSLFPWLLALLLIAGAAVAGWYIYQRVQDELSAREPVAVPNVEGLRQGRAVRLIENAGLQARVEREFSDEVEAGIVMEQDPDPGTRIQKGETVTIIVSAGVEQVVVPRLVGKDVSEALSQLSNLGLRARTRAVFSEQPLNIVVRQNPKAGTEVDKGSTVVLNVSKGVQMVAVPDVLFQSQSSAVAELEDAGLKVSVQEVESDEGKGLVVGQSAEPGTEVEVGTTVTISVSLGPPPVVTVPSVLGLDAESARATLEEAGLSVEVVEEPVLLPGNDGLVLQQDPGPGAEVEPESTVTIVVGRFILNGGGEGGAPPTGGQGDTTATAQ
jgi:serine/threonine-protein kinase